MAILNLVTSDNLDKLQSNRDYCRRQVDESVEEREQAYHLGAYHAFTDSIAVIEPTDVPVKEKSHKASNIMIGSGVIILGVVFWPEIKKQYKAMEVRVHARRDSRNA